MKTQAPKLAELVNFRSKVKMVVIPAEGLSILNTFESKV